MKSSGKHRSALVQCIPGTAYYRFRGLFLQHSFLHFTKSKACVHKVGEKEQRCWESYVGTIQQDAFAALLQEYNAFKNDLSFWL